MYITRVVLKNWRNFANVEVDIRDRLFIVGPNASGKSNFLDVFRFLRDLVKSGGGLQDAIMSRGGLSKIRCLAAKRYPDVSIDVEMKSDLDNPIADWRYAIGLKQENRGSRQPFITYERVWRKDEQILNRPDDSDAKDPARKSQTHLEQINANADFREIARHFESILYLHLVPQLLRHPEAFSGPEIPGDPFGRGLLNRIARTTSKTRDSRLRRIGDALRVAVPQMQKLEIKEDLGVPHLEARYMHWRERGAKQREDQFSDGTLRLIGLFWSLLEGDSTLLLEEPELSLNSAIVANLPALIHRIQRSKKRQILITTHSAELLSDRAIGGETVLLLKPEKEGTVAVLASSNTEIKELLSHGMSVADVVLPHTAPKESSELTLFDL